VKNSIRMRYNRNKSNNVSQPFLCPGCRVTECHSVCKVDVVCKLRPLSFRNDSTGLWSVAAGHVGHNSSVRSRFDAVHYNWNGLLWMWWFFSFFQQNIEKLTYWQDSIFRFFVCKTRVLIICPFPLDLIIMPAFNFLFFSSQRRWKIQFFNNPYFFYKYMYFLEQSRI